MHWAAQVLPHAPQLSLSERVFVHRPPLPASSAPQNSRLPGHVQAPLRQTSPWPQALPQAPQFLGLALVFTHWESAPQASLPAGQVQVLFSQTFPPVQVRPQPPQLAALVVVSTQAPAHSTSPAAHWVRQAPAEHTSVLAH
jgi:hypothetical protein